MKSTKTSESLFWNLDLVNYHNDNSIVYAI